MGKKYLAAFLAAVLMANSAITGFAAVGSAGNANGTSSSAGETFADGKKATASNAEQPEFDVVYTILPEELEDMAEVDGPDSVKAGKDLKFHVKPETGYEIESVTANGQALEGSRGLLGLGKSWSYQVEKVSEDCEVEIVLAEIASTAAGQNTKLVLANAPVQTSSNAVRVSETTGGETDVEFKSLSEAVDKAADEATVYVLRDLTATERSLIDKKTIAIDGQGHTVTRGENFTLASDTNRGGYNAAMIEVANGSRVTFTDITLDDAGFREGTKFEDAIGGDGDKKNEDRVQDAIIAAYGDGKGTIILGEETTLQNFGGLSAVRIGGKNGEGSTLIMESGSKIIDDGFTDREGGFAAVWNQGGTFTMEEGAEISDVYGRALYSEDGGKSEINGVISRITPVYNANFQEYKRATDGTGFAGIAVFEDASSEVTLGPSGRIRDITTSKRTDAVLFLWHASKFSMENGSEISDITEVGIVDCDGNNSVSIDGKITDCDLKNIAIRFRGNDNHFNLLENGIITNCATSDESIIYANSYRDELTISGELSKNRSKTASLFVGANQGGNNTTQTPVCTITETAKIRDNSGYGITAQQNQSLIVNGGEISGNTRGGIMLSAKTVTGPLSFTMSGGRITGNSSYGLSFTGTSVATAIADINGGVIENNGTGEVYASSLNSENENQRLSIKSGVVKGKRNVNISSELSEIFSGITPVGTLTLDENYADVHLGRAKSDAVNQIKSRVQTEHPDWTPIGTSALWIMPSTEEYHFTLTRPSSTKKTGLFAAYIPLKDDGTPADDAALTLEEVENQAEIDVTMKNLTPGTAYALMFVNNNEYTLSPDDITIYTGGGQGEETSESGFPTVTLNNCLDSIRKLEVNGKDTTFTGDAAMEHLVSLLSVSYQDENGNLVDDDTAAGEYEVHLELTDPSTKLQINENEVAGFEPGTLIVRHTENISAAQDGTITHLLAEEEPAAPVEHAVAVKKANATYYINNDNGRRITNTDGISILDDDLLLEDEGDNRQALLEAKAEEVLPETAPGEGYQYDFHYLDLVDAYNGNAWVSASSGSTVYLPYPEGTDSSTNFTLVHFMDLHREYGIRGQAQVEEAIANSQVELFQEGSADRPLEMTENGIRFEVGRSGFSPFALVWKVPTHKIFIERINDETGEIITTDELELREGQPYDVTSEAKKAISGYTFSHVEDETLLTGTSLTQDIVIKSYYTKDKTQYTVTVLYLDKDSREAIAEPFIKAFAVGTAYDVSEAQVTIDGYTFAETDKPLTGQAPADAADLEIRMFYTKNTDTPEPPKPETHTITVNYLDAETRQPIPGVQPYAEKKESGAAYDVTAAAGLAIEGYTRSTVEGDVSGTVGAADIVINVFYTKNAETPDPEPKPPVSHTVTVHYLEDGTGQVLKQASSVDVEDGSAYDVSHLTAAEIDGYRIVRVEGNAAGESLTGDLDIRVYYEKIPAETPGTDDENDDDDDGGRSGRGGTYTVGLNGRWVHMDPQNINIPISAPVPEGATPVTAPEYHQWKFILNDGTALRSQWAFVKNPYAVEGQPSEGWFCFDADGIMQYGWYLDTATQKWYYLHRTSDGMLGTMIEGWHFDEQDGKWYYLKPGTGEMLTGWQYIGEKWYYLNPTPMAVTWNFDEKTGGWTYNGAAERPFGSMYQNEMTPDGYFVDENGVWAQ